MVWKCLSDLSTGICLVNIGCSVDGRYIVNMHNIFKHTHTYTGDIYISRIKPPSRVQYVICPYLVKLLETLEVHYWPTQVAEMYKHNRELFVQALSLIKWRQLCHPNGCKMCKRVNDGGLWVRRRSKTNNTYYIRYIYGDSPIEAVYSLRWDWHYEW